MAPTLALRSRPWVATHTGLKGGLSPPPLRIPGSFHCALPLAGYIPAAPAIAANAAAARSSHFRFGPARKNTLAVSHRSFDVVLSAARGYVKRRFLFSSCEVGREKQNQTHRSTLKMPVAALKNHAGGSGTVFNFLIQNLSLYDLLNDIAISRAQKSRRREWHRFRLFNSKLKSL